MSQANRFTQTVYMLKSRIFRCGGLAQPGERMDYWGRQDFYAGVVFLLIMGMWYSFLFQPQQLRNAMLDDRLSVLKAQLYAENVQLTRLRRGIQSLERNDPKAWERAARSRLGWIKPGELADSDAIQKVVAVDMPRAWDWSLPERGVSPFRVPIRTVNNRTRAQLPPLLPQQVMQGQGGVSRPVLPPLSPYQSYALTPLFLPQERPATPPVPMRVPLRAPQPAPSNTRPMVAAIRSQ